MPAGRIAPHVNQSITGKDIAFQSSNQLLWLPVAGSRGKKIEEFGRPIPQEGTIEPILVPSALVSQLRAQQNGLWSRNGNLLNR
jgi:hypothetical protein